MIETIRLWQRSCDQRGRRGMCRETINRLGRLSLICDVRVSRCTLDLDQEFLRGWLVRLFGELLSPVRGEPRVDRR
jgi:hypothetical protein